MLPNILQSGTAESWKKKFPATFNLYQQLNPEPDFNKLAQSLVNTWLDTGSSGYANNHIEKSASQILIIRGDKDPLCSLADVTELAAIVKGSGILNIPFAGHAAFINESEIVTICLKRFFNHVN
nr:hypothetical protein [Mucilaginibacter sp. SP1R1]